MMSQEQTRDEENQDGIDFDSFSDAEKELNKYYAGMARIMNCNLITDKANMPESYLQVYTNLNYDKYLILEAEKSESTIEIVIPVSVNGKNGDLDYCLSWTGAHSIDYLAGQRIPVKHINNDVFRIEKFNDSALKYLPTSTIKTLIKKNVIKQEVYGQWSMSSIYAILLYLGLLVPLFLISYIIAEVLSISILFLLIPYVSLKILKMTFSR